MKQPQPQPTNAIDNSSRRLLGIGALSMLAWLVIAPGAFAQLARIASVEGEGEEVLLKRQDWTDFYRTHSRTLLWADDVLKVAPGTVVTLVCPDRTISDTLPAGESSVGEACPDAPRSVRPGFGVSNVWSAGDRSLPYVIAPWSDQVLTSTPDLRWNPVEEAEIYRVTLQQRQRGGWSEVWSVMTDQTTLCYPAHQPELEPGEEYALRVTVGTGATSAAEWTPPTVFSLISREEREVAAAAIAAVNAMEVSPELKTVILVEEIYPRHRLFAQGISDLLALIETGTDTAQVHRLLGDYFIRSGLEGPTEARYLRALELAEAMGYLEEQVQAQWGLGTLYNRVGNLEQAKTYLTAAQEGATALGDADLLARINAELGN